MAEELNMRASSTRLAGSSAETLVLSPLRFTPEVLFVKLTGAEEVGVNVDTAVIFWLQPLLHGS